jgi:hypothetical protein
MTTAAHAEIEPGAKRRRHSGQRSGTPAMKRTVRHVILPAMMPAIFFLIAATPVETLGCFTRGLLAVVVALLSGLAALGTAIMGARGRSRRDVYAPWWVLSTGILVIPVIALLILA